ncbi:MAG: DNA-directed RNA polymerase subunit omega [Crocinitomicaceae bacterium]|jgi:DNA-directed RNA polymerase subunit K/omega|nr:DNA-directed RNA polymerase subunit omega [Crocinitomicaceae bacterium]MDA8714571.1 DNA-directed RNA polymerase subunit omega [Flavobacteriales bacterium]MBT5403924.1 DNA-directed RNA polymerase subunit omega [Crocinitomicaceae bacterium]MBT6030886.1 DNA-directed RNA polymerase subunit omega [Crocinitomicaceae bacterium]MBT6515899.1 DNA-directed RNA polymerase subunit omega [Crocinitomicaceae bacterium]
MSYKNVVAEKTTITRNVSDIGDRLGNLYEGLVTISKRSRQINDGMKEELTAKLAEFASSTDNLEEIFENREQIEISRFYERLPKPVAIAVDEFLADKVYHRNPEGSE